MVFAKQDPIDRMGVVDSMANEACAVETGVRNRNSPEAIINRAR